MAFFSKSQYTPVKIVDPNTQDESKPHKKVQRQCRNIMIYGYCKFQDKGCIYYHPSAASLYSWTQLEPSSPTTTTATTATTTSTTTAMTPRLDSPASGALSAQAVNAPVFVPKSVATPTTSPHKSAADTSSQQATVTSLPSTPSASRTDSIGGDVFQTSESYDNYVFNPGDTSINTLLDQMQSLDTQYYDESQYNPYQQDYDTSGTYPYPAAPVFLRQPLNYHLYTPVPIPGPFVSSTKDSHFVPSSSSLHQTLQSRNETIRGIAPIGMELPDELQGYHTLVPLENITSPPERRKFLNWFSVVYRAIRVSDGLPYTLRRVENFRLTQQSAFAAIESWSKIRHPGIVSVQEAFTTRSFNDNSLVVCYAYHSNSRTLFDVHLKSKVAAFQSQMVSQQQPPQRGAQYFSSFGTAGSASQPMIPERIIWTYIVQIGSAIKQVHEAGLAVRTVDATKILVTGQNRVRIGACGLIDVLMHDTPQDVGILQHEDLLMFGRLLYALCCSTLAVTNGPSFQKSLDTIGRQYSQDLKNAILFLMSKAGPHRTIDQLLDMIRGKVLVDLNDALTATDRLENELLSELENARLVRLLCKFGFINERPEYANNLSSVSPDVNDDKTDSLGILDGRKQLDAGTDEKIMLVARDEQSCLVVSYKDVKQCIESAFLELARSSSAAKQQKSGHR
ncbi:hypothetical protein JOM56_011515 [Amanita muscaria]